MTGFFKITLLPAISTFKGSVIVTSPLYTTPLSE